MLLKSLLKKIFHLYEEPERPRIYITNTNYTPEADRLIFKPPTESERNALYNALVAHANEKCSLTIDSKDTSFTGTTNVMEEDQLINTIKSIPTHYAL